MSDKTVKTAKTPFVPLTGERLLPLFVKNTPASVAMFDKEMRYLMVSDRWLVDFGIEEKHIIGKSHYEVFPEILEMPEWLEIHRRTLSGETIKSEDDSFIRPDGRTEWLKWEVLPWYEDDGKQGGIIIMSEVITARKELEIERDHILENEKKLRAAAENAVRLKDEFLACVTHELRTPLSVIGGWVELLLNGDLSSDKYRDIFKILERHVDLELQIIEDILDFSSMRRGKIDIIKQTVSLNRVIADAVETIQFPAERKKIKVDVQFDRFEAAVLGDQRRIEQIIWNLLTNAIKFTPEGGHVSVVLQRDKGSVVIKVKDSGIGIKPDFLPKVFSMFEQQQNSFSKLRGGLGLGLAIAKNLVELHGGTISVESAGENMGSTFTVTLPLLPVLTQTDDTHHPQDLKTTPVTGKKILIVDDMPDVLSILELMLKNLGAEVTIASSADEAMRAIKSKLPDVVISDLSMPGKDGFTLVGSIQNLMQEEGGSLPTIALSAHSGEEFKRRALNSGFHAFLTKPVKIDSLISAITDIN